MTHSTIRHARHLCALSAALLLLFTGCASQHQSEQHSVTTRRTYSTSAPETDAPQTLSPDWLSGVDSGFTLPSLSDTITLPSDTTEYSRSLAMEALTLCSGHTVDRQEELLKAAGFEVVKQVNYDKSADDPAHTCAYTLGQRQLTHNGVSRTLFIVAVRGTEAGEWYSNFDFAPSHSDSTVFAENFLFAAQDVLTGIIEPLQGAAQTGKAPLVLVCGHSRGAACANLLGMLLNTQLGTQNVMTYTFATPATFRGEDCGVDCANIFNHINPSDIVTEVPFSAWGYHRLGNDIVLPGEEDTAGRIKVAVDTLQSIAPTISEYYSSRHSLTSAGLDPDKGITVFEFMLGIAASLQNNNAQSSGNNTDLLDAISSDSDFAPLTELLNHIMADNGKIAVEVLTQHLPSTYYILLSSLTD